MKISKDSWHYKLLTKDFWWSEGTHRYDISDSLCGYFWQVVFKTIGRTFSLIILPLVVLGWSVVAPLIQVVGWLSTGYWDSEGVGAAILIFEAYLATVLVAVGLVFWIKVKLEDVDKPQSVNIFTEYVKAKKDKVCPMLEFVDESQ